MTVTRSGFKADPIRGANAPVHARAPEMIRPARKQATGTSEGPDDASINEREGARLEPRGLAAQVGRQGRELLRGTQSARRDAAEPLGAHLVQVAVLALGSIAIEVLDAWRVDGAG